MGRTGQQENQDANKQMAATQAAHEANVEADRSSYLKSLGDLEAKGNPYESADFKQNENLLASEGAGAANASAQEGVDNAVGRTGTNTASEPYYRAMMAKDRMRSQGATLVAQKSADTQNANQWQQWLTGAKLAPSGIDTSMFSAATQGRDSALGNLTQFGLASYGPVNAAISATGAAIAGACPVAGSKYLMADGSEKLVEDLTVGDQLAGIDGEAQTIEEIQSAQAKVIRVMTENGKETCNSLTHAFALPHGGFTVASRALGKVILTADGASRVVGVIPDGVAEVFNVITDGSHTYCADGVWALGVGDAERYVSMETWSRVGRAMAEVN